MAFKNKVIELHVNPEISLNLKIMTSNENSGIRIICSIFAFILLISTTLDAKDQSSKIVSGQISIPLGLWEDRAELLSDVVNGNVDCEGSNGIYQGLLKNGIPEGVGKITMDDCPAIPIGIGKGEIGETCNNCCSAREWIGEFRNDELPYGKVLCTDGSTYEGPLFDLLPHGEGIVIVPGEEPVTRRFEFGWPREPYTQ